MRKKTFLISVLLALIIALVASFFWYSLSSGYFSEPTYTVQVRYGSPGIINNVERISVIFLDGNKTVASCIVSGGSTRTWQTVNIPMGIYIVKAYDADSGQYLKTYEINVSKDIKFEVSP